MGCCRGQEEGCLPTVVRDEPTRKPRTESTRSAGLPLRVARAGRSGCGKLSVPERRSSVWRMHRPCPCACRKACDGPPRPRPSKSRGHAPPMDAADRSGTTSSTPPAMSATDRRRSRDRTATTATVRTSRCCATSASTGTGSRSPGCVCSPMAGAGVLRRTRVLRPARRRPARGGHHPLPDPVPLGPSERTRSRGRMALTRHRRAIRRVRRGRRSCTRRSRQALVHDQRAGLDVPPGVRGRRAGTG